MIDAVSIDLFRDLFPHLWRLLVPSVLMQLIINAPCSYFRLMDNFTGLIEFIPGLIWSLYYSWQRQNYSLEFRQIFVTLCVCLWSLRLGGFLIYRMLIIGPLDTRIDNLRRKYGQLGVLGFWCGPHGFWSFICCLPVTLLHTLPLIEGKSNISDWIGITIWLCGFIMETWADRNKLQAKLVREGKYYHLGVLWNYCRNPNHCGEVFCWLGLSIIGFNLFFHQSSYQYNLCIFVLLLIGPLFTLSAMLFEATLTSEIKNNQRFGHQLDYLQYRKQTSILWPIPSIFYLRLPSWIRKICFFEFNLYSEGLKKQIE
ncbi:hypothetical protein I4U23_015342 [Adineta vaga]|nr:hypothetical protein I4U23_015342 [Adineta vaga]